MPGYVRDYERYDAGDGRFLTREEIAAETGLKASQVGKRIAYGWRGTALMRPKDEGRTPADKAAARQKVASSKWRRGRLVSAFRDRGEP